MHITINRREIILKHPDIIFHKSRGQCTKFVDTYEPLLVDLLGTHLNYSQTNPYFHMRNFFVWFGLYADHHLYNLKFPSLPRSPILKKRSVTSAAKHGPHMQIFLRFSRCI